MADNSGKTEKATPQRRQDEVKKGNLFQSKDVVSAVSLLFAVFVLRVAASYLFTGLRDIVRAGCMPVSSAGGLSVTAASKLMSTLVFDSIRLILPVCLSMIASAVILTGVQTRFRFTGSLLAPKMSRLSPLSGIKKMLSMKSLVELFKSLVKLTVILAVLYTDIRADIEQVLVLPFAGLQDAMEWIFSTAYSSMMKMAAIMAVFGVADYAYQWWSYERSIRMTKQEVRDEFKRMEGDPHIKGRIREIQRKMATSRMMLNVSTANVVVRNPTHYAVALRYDPKQDSAPVVVAKGRDHIALQIIRIAEQHGIHITEDRPLARGLYEAVEVDQTIPEEFYRAVAELIAYLYRLKNGESGRR